MILITSAQYIEGDLLAELGPIIPAMLPVGLKRLWTHQIRTLNKNDKIYLSVPSSYVIGDFDQQQLDENNINVVTAPDSLSLGESVCHCLKKIKSFSEKLIILHGDTLILDAKEISPNSISVARNKGMYPRTAVTQNSTLNLKFGIFGEGDIVASGLFRFENPQLLLNKIEEADGSFIQGIELYSKESKLNQKFTEKWYDFGHVNSFFQSRTMITTQRCFNSLVIKNGIVVKASSQHSKILAEGNWYNSITDELKVHTPQLLSIKSEDNPSYSIEYLFALPLNDIYVFGRLLALEWYYLFKQCREVLSKMSSSEVNQNKPSSSGLSLDNLLPKTRARLRDFDFSLCKISDEKKYSLNGYDDISIKEIIQKISKVSFCESEEGSIVHGDFCFSNLLFDFRSDKLIMLDPRGVDFNQNMTIFGDQRYDVAKLFHSVLGLYDFIVSDRYILEINGNEINFCIEHPKNYSDILQAFDSIFFKQSNFVKSEIIVICMHLFLSMLPLHSECERRQTAFLANVFRLYWIFEGIE